MIMLVGPNNSGKTALAEQLYQRGMSYIHCVRETTYADYLDMLDYDVSNTVFDRCMWCDIPYGDNKIDGKLGREFTGKQMQSYTLSMLIRNPLVIICAHDVEVSEESLLLYQDYRKFLEDSRIPFCTYDYSMFLTKREVLVSGALLREQVDITQFDDSLMYPIDLIMNMNAHLANQQSWINPLLQSNRFPIGSQHPSLLIIAERLGPSNAKSIPFEAGPTGAMMAEILTKSGIPLGDIAITNMVKDEVGSTRKPNKQDKELLDLELDNLKPCYVLLMGKVATAAAPILSKRKTGYIELEHLGALHRRGVTNLTAYTSEVRKAYDKAVEIRKGGDSKRWKSVIIPCE